MLPSVLSTGATQDKVAEPAITEMENGPIDALLLPLVAVMVMLLVVPTLATAGAPLNVPVLALKVAQVG